MKADMDATTWTPERIKSLRERYGEHQKAFAERFGASVQAIQSWEQGKRAPGGSAKIILAMLEEKLDHRMSRQPVGA